MSNYFTDFPTTTYGNIVCTNITIRAKMLSLVKQYKSLYYTYDVKEGERADTVAFNYYGSCEYDWLIFLVNDILDPYYDWVMSQDVFDSFLIKKYGSIEEAQTTIKHYKKKPVTWYHQIDGDGFLSETQWLIQGSPNNYNAIIQDDDITISIETYSKLPDLNEWVPVYAYDYEFDLNESKRTIKLIDTKYKTRLSTDLSNLIG